MGRFHAIQRGRLISVAPAPSRRLQKGVLPHIAYSVPPPYIQTARTVLTEKETRTIPDSKMSTNHLAVSTHTLGFIQHSLVALGLTTDVSGGLHDVLCFGN